MKTDVATLEKECKNLRDMLVDHNKMKDFAMSLERDLREARQDKKIAEQVS